MTQPSFEIVFNGRLKAGADAGVVRANLAKLFKVDAARIKALFAGTRVVIKKGLDEVAARNYAAALLKAGAEVDIVSASDISTTATAPTPTVLTIAEPGVLLVEAPPISTANFDTSALSLAEVGVTLVEPTQPPAPTFDLSRFKLDPPGTLLVEPKAIPPATIDVSGLSLTEQPKPR